MKEHLDEDIIDVFVNTGDQLSAKDLILKRFTETNETLSEQWNKSLASYMNDQVQEKSRSGLALGNFEKIKARSEGSGRIQKVEHFAFKFSKGIEQQ